MRKNDSARPCASLRRARKGETVLLYLGCHLSAAKGFLAMGKEAVKAGANTFQFFTRNPRGGRAKEIDPKDVEAFLALEKEHAFGPIVAHAPYTMNVCSADEKTREFGNGLLRDDLARMEYVPGNYYNLHPGSHVGQGVDEGIRLICEAINAALKPEQTTAVLLETMAGKGSEVGGRFEEIRRILDGIELKEKMGVCLDTCHVSDAGYDVIGDFDGVLREFDRVVGLDRLKAIHLNDSKNPPGSHKDRHEKIGGGDIGFAAIMRVVNHPALRGLPFVLETPNDLDGYAAEIARIRGAYGEADAGSAV